MADPETDDSLAPLATIDGLRPVWDRFRQGGIAPCPIDAGPMALGVDGSADTYRFVCVRCGHASPWFEAKLARLALRGQGEVIAPPPSRGAPGA
jgi:hypothetical protein